LAKVLVLGDTHIPDRASRAPKALVEIVEKGAPWEFVIFTGDLTGEGTLNWVKNLGRRLYIVRGNMDYLPLKKTAVLEVGRLKIGVHHGDGVYPRGDVGRLTEIARSLGVDILVSGHTHADFVKVGFTGEELLVNPGSFTGVWGGGGSSYTPSFMVLEIAANAIIITTFKIKNTQLNKIVTTAYRRSDGVWVLEEYK